MPKSEREEILSALTSRILSAMLEDLVMDATLQSHHEIARSRAICRTCNTRCGSVHTPGPSNVPHVVPSSRADTPSITGDTKVTGNGSSGTGTNTPTSVKDGNLYLECVNCSRQIASSRYAPHLSTCMGLASARRGAVRGNTKSKHPSEAGRSVSPASDIGNFSDNGSKLKNKGKSKVKRVDEAEFNLKRKRPGSPQISPNKKSKKQKASGSPVSRVKAGPEPLKMANNIHYSPSAPSKVPSKLRDSSTAPFVDKSSSSDSSRSSSPEGASIATPASSSFSHSPHLSSKKIGNNNNKPKASGIGPPKRLSPPRPPPLHVADYSIDVEGDETGSSTDTDSS